MRQHQEMPMLSASVILLPLSVGVLTSGEDVLLVMKTNNKQDIETITKAS
jgi:hypothetical protein